MRSAFASFLLLLCLVPAGRAADDSELVAVAQKLFDAMKTHDGAAAGALFLPGAALASVDGKGATSVMPFEKFVERVGSGKGVWVERIWNAKVHQHGAIGVVWADYDFYRDGKFSHCGVDVFELLKTEGGWKIAGVSDSRVTEGCEANPAGAPR